jgi:glycosyltransferase involved in cell wall biosynthesis
VEELMSNFLRVTAYIPCYNAERYIFQAIKGLINQSYPVDEILVIDDGSSDRSVEIASSLQGQGRIPLRIIRLKRNEGLSVARNTAFYMARNDYVAAIDADCIPDPEWLNRLVTTFISYPEAAGVGGRLIESHTVTIADQWRASLLKQH